MSTIALIVTDTRQTPLGWSARLDETLAGRNVLMHTLERAARIDQAKQVVVVHPTGQSVEHLIDPAVAGKPVRTLASDRFAESTAHRRWQVGRKWAPQAWRGGLGGASVYDELLPAGPVAQAMEAFGADSAAVVRAEWCLFDPELARQQLALHLEYPEAFKMTFTQAPPGLGALAVGRGLVEELSTKQGSIGQMLAYNPRAPQADPIGREANVPISHVVRDTAMRFVYDGPRGVALLQALADRLGADLAEADALRVAETARAVAEQPGAMRQRLPQQVTLELTPNRPAAGPITPHHYVNFDRPMLDPQVAERLFEQFSDPAVAGDVALRLGGLGDALHHPQWDRIVRAACEAGVHGVGVETDLLCEPAEVDRLCELPIDLVSVRLNADGPETYRRVMGEDAFEKVTENLKRVHAHRQGNDGLPWLVPRLTKTAETLGDMESFFDRWTLAGGHAVIEPPQSGCGLMPELSLQVMAPPRRGPCRQLGGRMTVLSDGRVARCDQDWLGRAEMGDAREETLIDIWQRVEAPVTLHREGRFDELDLCAGCQEWHRP